MLIEPYIIDKLRTEIPIEQVLRRLGYAIPNDVKGNIPCPFHHEKDGSFHIYPNANNARCYGACQHTWDTIGVVEKALGRDFVGSCEWLAQEFGIELKWEQTTPEAEERMARDKRVKGVLARCRDWFVEQMAKESGSKCREYALSRFSADTVDDWQIGYCPQRNYELRSVLMNEGYSEDELVESKVYARKVDGGIYCVFYERMMIPICDNGGRVISFVGRDLTGTDNRKYLYPAGFRKDEHLFGWSRARVRAEKDNRLYIVEGQADCIKMHEVGQNNTIAMGTCKMSDVQLKMIRKSKVQDIYLFLDGDAAGVEGTYHTGKKLVDCGYNVYVYGPAVKWEDDMGKSDPADVLSGMDVKDVHKKLDKLDRQNFYAFYLRYNIRGHINPESKTFENPVDVNEPINAERLAKDTLEIMMHLEPSTRKSYVYDSLMPMVGNERLWKECEKKVLAKHKKMEIDEEEKNENGLTFEQQKMAADFGIIIGNYGKEVNSYFSGDKNRKRLSNFVLQPILHIYGENGDSKRLFTLLNNQGKDWVVELTEEQMGSVDKFDLATSRFGNCLWQGKKESLNSLRSYLYAQMDTVNEVKQMGWDEDKEMWVWSNGCVDNRGNFLHVDSNGVVSVNGKSYYIPVFSDFYANNKRLFVKERHLKHNEHDQSSFAELCERMAYVYGDNAIVGVGFYLATLFRDIVCKDNNQGFPLLNIFGQRGTGKTSMGYTICSLFGDEPIETKMSATQTAVRNTIAMPRNMTCLIDEYTSINVSNDRAMLAKVEFLKGAYNGIITSRMNMDTKEVESFSAMGGVILCGQDMATADDALFSRVLFIEVTETTFSEQRVQAFRSLQSWQSNGLTNITNTLLRYRSDMEENYEECYDIAKKEIEAVVGKDAMRFVEGRTIHNWTILLATYMALKERIGMMLPWNYREITSLIGTYMMKQHHMNHGLSDMALFWNTVEAMYSSRTIEEGYEYRIVRNKIPGLVKVNGEEWEEHTPTDLIYINVNAFFSTYDRFKRIEGTTRGRGSDSIKQYLRGDRFLWRTPTKCSYKFYLRQNNAEVRIEGGSMNNFNAWCLDYTNLCTQYGIRLDNDDRYDDAYEGVEQTEEEKQWHDARLDDGNEIF